MSTSFPVRQLGRRPDPGGPAAGRDVRPRGDRHLLGSGLACFLLLAGMFGLSVVLGHAGLPHLRPGMLAVRATLALHCLVTAVIAAAAVGLSAVIEHVGEPREPADRWLLCGAMAAYFLLGLTASAGASWARRRWRPAVIVIWLYAGVAVLILLGVFAADVDGQVLVWYLALVVGWHLLYEHRRRAGRLVLGSVMTHTAGMTTELRW